MEEPKNIGVKRCLGYVFHFTVALY